MRDHQPLDETVRSRAVRADEGDKRELGGMNWSGIPPRVWAFAVVAVILLLGLFGFWGLYLFRGRLGASGPTPTAIIWTPTPSPTTRATDTPTANETAVGEPGEATPAPSDDIVIGGYVKVSGTGGYGLSLRDGPGANYTRMDIAAEDEVFIVVEGPKTAGGDPWWRIRDPDDEDRTWWAIGNYLQPVAHP